MNFLTRLSIKHRLQLNAIVIGIGLIILLVLMFSNLSRILVLSSASESVEKLNTDVLLLRRNEKDFLARKDPKYLDKFSNNFARLSQGITELQTVFKEVEINNSDCLLYTSDAADD